MRLGVDTIRVDVNSIGARFCVGYMADIVVVVVHILHLSSVEFIRIQAQPNACRREIDQRKTTTTSRKCLDSFAIRKQQSACEPYSQFDTDTIFLLRFENAI